jgi:hypothetical protein
MSTQPELDLDCEEPEFDIVCCDICGDDSLNSEAHSWSDQRKYSDKNGTAIYLATQQETVQDGYVIMCDGCREDYVYAYDAEALCHNEYAVYVDCRDAYYTEEYACDNFYRDDNGYWHDEPPSALHDYSTRVTDYFSPSPTSFGKRLVMGIELECEPKGYNSQTDLVESVDGPTGDNFICTEDGSLDDGMELCTMPFTMEDHKSFRYVKWNEILASLQPIARSGQGTTACGMHIHVNRRALSQLQIGKMLVFANSAKNDSMLRTIFQRASCEYASRKRDAKIQDGKSHYSGRCERINLQPDATIEVRAFRGNLRLERVLKNIEFVHAMAIFCRDVSMRNVENWHEFSRFVDSRKGIYPNLRSFMIERNILGG